MTVLLLAVSTAIILSARNANRKGEKVWNATSRRLLVSMAVPLVTGGVLILVFLLKDMIGWLAPLFHRLHRFHNAFDYVQDFLLAMR